MKVLIISHNPLCTYNNMGKTLLSLFSEFRKEELCQLYIYPSLPDVDKCCSYYRITDREVLRSLFTWRVVGGVQFPNTKSHVAFENANDEMQYRDPKNKSAVRTLGRDALWKVSHWFNSKLKEWIDQQHPTCIFVAPGRAKFIYDFAIDISKKYRLPIVTYFADDYYFLKKPNRIIDKLQWHLLRKKIRNTVIKSAYCIMICKQMQESYENEFCVPMVTLMTGATIPISDKVSLLPSPSTITYMGNIRCNRYKSLVDIGLALDEINEECGKEYRLHIYTNEKDIGIRSVLDEINSVCLHDYVTGEEFFEVFNSVEINLHVEAFDLDSIMRVKNSVTTKLADCLASGKLLFAYGPNNIASMRYLATQKCAHIVTKRNELKAGIKAMFTSNDYNIEYALNSINAAHLYHDRAQNSMNLYALLKNLKRNK